MPADAQCCPGEAGCAQERWAASSPWWSARLCSQHQSPSETWPEREQSWSVTWPRSTVAQPLTFMVGWRKCLFPLPLSGGGGVAQGRGGVRSALPCSPHAPVLEIWTKDDGTGIARMVQFTFSLSTQSRWQGGYPQVGVGVILTMLFSEHNYLYQPEWQLRFTFKIQHYWR